VLRIKVPPNTALHWHHHPVISVGYVLPGELKVEKRETGEPTLVHAGQTLAETVQTKERYMKVKCGLTMVVQILAAAFMPPAIVLAQAPANPSAATETGGQLQQITVTGYVIPRIGQGPQPVVTYDRDYVDKLGYQTATDLIRALPFNNAALAPLTNSGINSSPASSAPNLRGLNVSSTLTLVDGHRFPDFPIPLGGTLSFVDLNSIPLAAIDRIEILKDGASAVYGDDAVAGVVNIILKDEYNGAEIYNYYSITDRGDAETYHGQSLVERRPNCGPTTPN
jgi:outer membrane receptor protein involved in Fe transport